VYGSGIIVELMMAVMMVCWLLLLDFTLHAAVLQLLLLSVGKSRVAVV
jgi:hypothetical protein